MIIGTTHIVIETLGASSIYDVVPHHVIIVWHISFYVIAPTQGSFFRALFANALLIFFNIEHMMCALFTYYTLYSYNMHFFRGVHYCIHQYHIIVLIICLLLICTICRRS